MTSTETSGRGTESIIAAALLCTTTSTCQGPSASARINAGARMNDMSYSKLMGGLKKANVDLDRKVLANLAILDAGAFSKVVQIAKEANA